MLPKMNMEDIHSRVPAGEYVYTLHADIERKADDLTLGPG